MPPENNDSWSCVIKGLHSVKSRYQLFIYLFLLARLAGARSHRVVLRRLYYNINKENNVY